MAFELRDNSGALFKNTNKKEERHPDYTGNVMVNGKKMQIAAWIKSGKKGKFMSLSFSEPREESSRPRESRSGFEDMEDD